MKQALLIIDVQNYFINKWTQEIPKNIVKLLQEGDFSAVAFTKFVNTPDSNFVKQFNYTSCGKPPYTDIVNDLAPWVKSNNVFTKNTYSAFIKPDLLNFLKANKITDVCLVGIDTENCLLTNARDCFDRGFKVTVAASGCQSHSGGNKIHETALEIIAKNIGELV